MREISSSVDIRASPVQVWDVLADFAGYAAWNPFLREGAGRAEAGCTLVLRMHPATGRPLTFRPTVLVAERGRTLRWVGRLLLPGLFDGTHEFALTATAEGTHLVQSETFTGLLVPFLGGMVDRAGGDFARLNAALKRRLEREADPPAR